MEGTGFFMGSVIGSTLEATQPLVKGLSVKGEVMGFTETLQLRKPGGVAAGALPMHGVRGVAVLVQEPGLEGPQGLLRTPKDGVVEDEHGQQRSRGVRLC
jgi:hypothetical protein